MDSRQALTCVQSSNGSLVQPPCFFFQDRPAIPVAPNSRHISVTAFRTKPATDLLMTYQDSSNHLVISHGFLSGPDTWSWNNVTTNFSSLATNFSIYDDVDLTGPCTSYISSQAGLLYCFTRSQNRSQSLDQRGILVLNFSITASGKF